MQTEIRLSIPLKEYAALPSSSDPYTDGKDVYAYFCKKSRKKLPKHCVFTKKSIDARHKKDIRVVVNALFSDQDLRGEIESSPVTDMHVKPSSKGTVVVCGCGPAGLFAAASLVEAGIHTILLERGADIDTRTSDVEELRSSGKLNIHSNIQFGEGGAGTFSDGKLFSGVSDPRRERVLRTFVRYGAPKTILYDAHPHIGTDILRDVIRTMRQDLVKKGAIVRFQRILSDITSSDGKITSVTSVDAVSGEDKETIPCVGLILAIGHSARDTFSMLSQRGIHLENKPFAVGVRIEHLQREIDQAQFGEEFENEILRPANYKVVTPTSTGRKLYSFCMCPGGEVVCGSSEEGGVVTNGMSEYARDKENANSAMLVGVDVEDYGNDSWENGILFQRELERKAYSLGDSAYYAPAQRVGDFHERKKTTSWGKVKPSYRPGVTMSNLWDVLPVEVARTLDEGLVLLEKKIHGFNDPDAVLTAVETRSSSPVRIRRDENGESLSMTGVFPAGEGAGYAGGIMSSAIDGIRQAEALILRYFHEEMV